jgi:hypothetical protein
MGTKAQKIVPHLVVPGVAFAYAVLFAGVASALAQATSEPEALARASKFADQVVRVIPRHTDGGSAEEGFGLIVGQAAGELYIATPRHVAFGRDRVSLLSPTPEVVFHGAPYSPIPARRLDVASQRDDLAVLQVALPQRVAMSYAPMVLAARLPRGTWVWNIGIDRKWEMPDRAGGLGPEEVETGWRRIGSLRTPPGASGGAGVTESGVIGIVLQDAGLGSDYSVLLPVERIVQLFTAWGFPVNLLAAGGEPSFRRVYYEHFDYDPRKIPTATAEVWPLGRYGDWETKIANGVLTLCNVSDHPGASYTNRLAYVETKGQPIDQADAKVTMRVRLAKSTATTRGVGIMFRKSLSEDGYYALLATPGNVVTLYVNTGKTLTALWSGDSIPPDSDGFYTLKVEGRGNTIDLYANDRLVRTQGGITLMHGDPGAMVLGPGCFDLADIAVFLPR